MEYRTSLFKIRKGHWRALASIASLILLCSLTQQTNMDMIIQENFEVLTARIKNFNHAEIKERQLEIDPEKMSALAGKSYEIAGESICAEFYVFESKFDAVKQFEQWDKTPPLPSRQHKVMGMMTMGVFIHTDETSSEAYTRMEQLASTLAGEE